MDWSGTCRTDEEPGVVQEDVASRALVQVAGARGGRPCGPEREQEVAGPETAGQAVTQVEAGQEADGQLRSGEMLGGELAYR